MSHFDFFNEWNKVVQLQYEGCPGYWEDDAFYYRLVVDGEMEVGVKLLFDRWANSVDAVFSLPKTYRGFNIVRQNLGAFGRAVAVLDEHARKRQFARLIDQRRRISTRRIEMPRFRRLEGVTSCRRLPNPSKGANRA